MKLIQYQIHKNLDQKVFREIGKNILKNDKVWHFFHEGNYSLIRMGEDVVRQRELEKFLNKNKIKFDKRPYEDPHELVRKYQGLFEAAFHSFTVLGLIREEGEMYSLLERMVHCMLNMAGYTGLDEEVAIARLGVFRATIHRQYEARSMAQSTCIEFEKFKREKPDEFEKQFAAVPAPKRGR